MIKRISTVTLLASLAFAAGSSLVQGGCDDGSDELLDRGPAGSDAGGDDAIAAANTCSNRQKSYPGFGTTKLEIARLETAIGLDRTRMKPFPMLVDEYKRVLGVSPSVLTESAATFGDPPARWFNEPRPSAVSLYQAYRVAFEGCLEYTKTDAKYAAMPTAVTAPEECAAMQRKFWSQTPSPDEAQACADVATRDSAMELQAGENKPTDPRRRWAYACASVLTAPGFLMF